MVLVAGLLFSASAVTLWPGVLSGEEILGDTALMNMLFVSPVFFSVLITQRSGTVTLTQSTLEVSRHQWSIDEDAQHRWALILFEAQRRRERLQEEGDPE